MPPVNWDLPSTGLVSDPSPSLVLKNDQNGALIAAAEEVAVEAESNNSHALRARTQKTLTADVESKEFVALVARAPKSLAAAGANQSSAIAVAGLNATDPNVPNPVNNPDGVGVAGITARFRATGVVGSAIGSRSLGVLGQANSGVGVRGIGSSNGVEGLSDSNGVLGQTSGGKAAGVAGVASEGLAAGVRGLAEGGPGVEAASNAGPGVRATSQQAEGVVAEASAANAAGVRGQNDHANGVGVDGSSNSGVALRGLSTKGTAVYADSLTGRAVDASNFSQSEPAIYALAPLLPAVEANSVSSPGVKALGKTGVYGASITPPDSDNPEVGAGVFGVGFSGAGVSGITVAGTAVVGVGSPNLGAWAGHFQGNVFVQGTLFKQVSLFSIDHPLDPKRKVLNHAAVEAPEHKTFYDGVARLDARGRAKVRLPRWFEALNNVRALRYQLTPMGRPAPDLHVEKGFNKGVFVIAGGRPRQKVCWQVTGVRRDAAAKANPVVVEQSKTKARPSEVNLRPADLRRMRADLKKSAAKLKPEAAARERLIKSRRLPGPLPAAPLPKIDEKMGASTKLVEETVKLVRGLSGRK